MTLSSPENLAKPHTDGQAEQRAEERVNERADYRAKITQTRLNQSAPQLELPSDVPLSANAEMTIERAPAWGSWALGLGVLCIVAFAVVDAVQSLQSSFAQSPWVSSLLAALLLAFVALLGLFIGREIQGYRSITPFLNTQGRLKDLNRKDDLAFTLMTLKKAAKQQAGSGLARACYRRFFSTLKPHHSNAEVLAIYQQTVQQPIHAQAQAVLKKESLMSGGLAFISPNSFIQTSLILWVSLRTLRRIAQVYGLRPGKVGGAKLVRITLENLAAQSLLDLMTDEMANQMGRSLAGKFIENSAEAVAASALNLRLGKALIRQLEGKLDSKLDSKLDDTLAGK